MNEELVQSVMKPDAGSRLRFIQFPKASVQVCQTARPFTLPYPQFPRTTPSYVSCRLSSISAPAKGSQKIMRD